MPKMRKQSFRECETGGPPSVLESQRDSLYEYGDDEMSDTTRCWCSGNGECVYCYEVARDMDMEDPNDRQS